MREAPCTNCQKPKGDGQWWCLSNYFGISGFFCPDCYKKVSHDAYQNPEMPDDYLTILEKQQQRS